MTDETPAESGPANTPPFPRPAPPPLESEPAGASAANGQPAADAFADDEDFGEDQALFGDAAPFEDEGAPDEPARPSGRRDARAGGAFGRASEEIVRRAERTLYHGLGHLADRFEDAAQRIDQLADERLHALGPRAERAAGAAGSAAAWLADAADYLRTSDLRSLQRDLEGQVREKPLQTLVVSAGAGWLLGKIVR